MQHGFSAYQPKRQWELCLQHASLKFLQAVYSVPAIPGNHSPQDDAPMLNVPLDRGLHFV